MLHAGVCCGYIHLKNRQEITPLLNIEILCPDALAVFLKSWVSGFVEIFREKTFHDYVSDESMCLCIRC